MKVINYRRGPRFHAKFWMVRGAIRRLSAVFMASVDRPVAKQPRRVVLGSDKGLKYSGNARDLFEYLVQQADWDPYWLAVSPAILDEINARFPGRAVRAWSWRALKMGLSAQWLGFSHSRYDLGPFAYLKRPRFIYLNHGTPLKTMGYAKAFDDPATANTARGIGAVTCCSAFEASLWARAFGLPLERMWVTGAPRNDRLFTRDERVLERLGIAPGRRVVLFAPTYRETGVLSNYLPTPDLAAGDLVDLLTRHNTILLIRPHYYEWEAAKAMVDGIKSEFVRTADESIVPDVNELLPVVDVLVTDYSSIYFDFLLLDRPIVFSCYDLEEYKRDRGLMIDYDSNTPGHKTATAGELLSALDDLLSGKDPHRDARAEVRQRFHRFTDAKSAERVADRIERSSASGTVKPAD